LIKNCVFFLKIEEDRAKNIAFSSGTNQQNSRILTTEITENTEEKKGKGRKTAAFFSLSPCTLRSR
jgi:hypothetical protein